MANPQTSVSSPTVPKQSTWGKAAVFLVLLVLAGYALLTAFSGLPLRQQQPRFFISIALALAVCAGAVAYYRSGDKDPRDRYIWVAADAFWLLLSLYVIGKLLTPFFDSIERDTVTQQNTAIMRTVWTIKDAECSLVQVDKTSPQQQQLCRVISQLERELLLDINAYHEPVHGNESQLEKICGAGCSMQTKMLIEQIKALKPPHAGSDISLTLIYLCTLVPLWSFRVGRTIAEFFRTRSEVKKAKQAAEEKRKAKASKADAATVAAPTGDAAQASTTADAPPPSEALPPGSASSASHAQASSAA